MTCSGSPKVCSRAPFRFVQSWLDAHGVPLDLSEFRTSVPSPTLRTVLELPLEVARQHRKSVVLFIDELQRAVDYADGVRLVTGLVDLYAGNPDVLILIDGSETRMVEQLVGQPPIRWASSPSVWNSSLVSRRTNGAHRFAVASDTPG